MLRPIICACLAIALGLTSFALPVQAGSCRQQAGHKICLNRVKRSAKYHWQYRVQATIDGEPQPLTRYNCRHRIRTPMEGPQKGRSEKFIAEGIGDRLCRLVNR